MSAPVLVDQLMTLQEAAQHLGLSHSHLRLLARQGKVQAFRKGRLWLTTAAAVRGYLQSEPRPGPKPRGDKTA